MSERGPEIGREGAASAQATDSVPPAPPKPWRRLPLDDAAFSTITKESAYWVGFLMADGCVMHPKDGSPEVALRLSVIDREQVEAFRRFLKSSKKVTVQSAPSHYTVVNKRPVRSGPSVLFSVSSTQLATDLSSFGVVPHKTMREHVLRLESNRDFWRGMVDGDGSVFCSEAGGNGEVPNIKLNGSHSITSQFQAWVGSILPSCKTRPLPHNGIWRFSLNSRQGFRVIQELYANCATALPRKLVIAQHILSNGIPDGGWGRFRRTVRH